MSVCAKDCEIYRAKRFCSRAREDDSCEGCRHYKPICHFDWCAYYAVCLSPDRDNGLPGKKGDRA